MIALTREEFYERPELKTQEVSIPEWGDVEGEPRGVIVREFSASQRIELMKDWQDIVGVDTDAPPADKAGRMYEFWARVASWSMVDGEGTRLCQTPDDAVAVLDSSLDVVRTIGEAAMRLNGLLNDEDEPAKKKKRRTAKSSRSGSA